MRQGEGERRRRFNALFESYSSDIVAYCGWRAGSASDALDVALTVGAGGAVREIAVIWGTGDWRWTYTVTYTRLGVTAAPAAPANARPLKRSPAG